MTRPSNGRQVDTGRKKRHKTWHFKVPQEIERDKSSSDRSPPSPQRQGLRPGCHSKVALEANVKVKGFGKVQDRPQSGPGEHLHAKEQLTLLAALEAPAVQHKLFTSLLAAFRSSRESGRRQDLCSIVGASDYRGRLLCHVNLFTNFHQLCFRVGSISIEALNWCAINAAEKYLHRERPEVLLNRCAGTTWLGDIIWSMTNGSHFGHFRVLECRVVSSTRCFAICCWCLPHWLLFVSVKRNVAADAVTQDKNGTERHRVNYTQKTWVDMKHHEAASGSQTSLANLSSLL